MTLTTQQVEGNGMNVFGEQNGFTAMTSDELLHINGGSQVNWIISPPASLPFPIGGY